MLVHSEMWRQLGAMGLSSTTQITASSLLSAGDRSIRSSSCLNSRLRIKRDVVVRERRARSLPIRSVFNTIRSPGGDSGGARPPSGFGTTRLGRIIGAGQREFSSRFRNVRKKFPLKVFLLLLGYYSANALATILGQTGDWDVLAAGILVAVIEGVGYLMYRAPSVLGERGKELIGYVNFWKSGFSFGLFVDAFKLGS